MANKINYTGSSKILKRLCESVNDIIESGGGGSVVLINKNITQNGTYNAVTVDSADGYREVVVNVSNSYSAGDEGKVVNGGALVPQSSTTKTANGTYNTTLNNEVVVNVPNSYAAGDEGKVVSNGALVVQTSDTVTANDTYDTTLINQLTVNVAGGGGNIPIISKSVWDAMTIEQKRSYGLLIIQTASTGYDRGKYVNGADYPIWADIKTIKMSGKTRMSSVYTQLSGMRFRNSNNEYLPSQKNNIASSVTTYGSWISGAAEGNTQYLYDNSADYKAISSGNDNNREFEWTTTFTDPIDISGFPILELWTANDSAERDPYTDVVITFYGIDGNYKTLTIASTSMTGTRKALGYTNSNYQTEAV